MSMSISIFASLPFWYDPFHRNQYQYLPPCHLGSMQDRLRIWSMVIPQILSITVATISINKGFCFTREKIWQHVHQSMKSIRNGEALSAPLNSFLSHPHEIIMKVDHKKHQDYSHPQEWPGLISPFYFYPIPIKAS